MVPVISSWRLFALTEARLVPDVLEQDVQGLQQLDADETGAPALLPHDVQKVGQHVLLQEEARRVGQFRWEDRWMERISGNLLKHRAVILVSPDKDLGNGP